LAEAGRIRRAKGPTGKIANYPGTPVSGDARAHVAISAVVEPDIEGEVVRKRNSYCAADLAFRDIGSSIQ